MGEHDLVGEAGVCRCSGAGGLITPENPCPVHGPFTVRKTDSFMESVAKPFLEPAEPELAIKPTTGLPPATRTPWSRVEVTGGRHGKDTKVVVDGVEQQRVYRTELFTDARDANRVVIYRFAEPTYSLDAMVENRVTPRYVLTAKDLAQKLKAYGRSLDGQRVDFLELDREGLIEIAASILETVPEP